MALPLYEDPAPSNPDFFDGEPSLPSFTTAIRGYQKEEVHAFLRELRQEHSDESRDRQRLERETQELRQRVASLERAMSTTTPHTIDALGERMLLILHHAEAASTDAVSAAEAYAVQVREEAASRAESHVRQASLRASQATQTLNAARAEAQRCIEETRAAVATRRDAELREAERIAADLVATARATAEGLVSGATAEADTLLINARAEVERLLRGATAEAERLVTGARRRAATLERDSNAQAEALVTNARSQAETMVAEATARAAELEARAKEADELIREQIGEREALAYAHLEALADQRDDLLTEMGEIHASLARTLRASGFASPDDERRPTEHQEERRPTQEQPAVASEE